MLQTNWNVTFGMDKVFIKLTIYYLGLHETKINVANPFAAYAKTITYVEQVDKDGDIYGVKFVIFGSQNSKFDESFYQINIFSKTLMSQMSLNMVSIN